jgi:hypothetical protein
MASTYIRSLRRFWIAISLVWFAGAVSVVWFTHANIMSDAVRAQFAWCQRQPDRKWDQCWEERQNAGLEVTPKVVTQMGLVGIAPVVVVWLAGWGALVTARRWRRRLRAASARQPSTSRMLT